jgi:hypothetical protein
MCRVGPVAGSGQEWVRHDLRKPRRKMSQTLANAIAGQTLKWKIVLAKNTISTPLEAGE